MLKPSEIESLKKQFITMDTDMSGFISIQELGEALKNSKHTLSAEGIKKIIDEVDYADN